MVRCQTIEKIKHGVRKPNSKLKTLKKKIIVGHIGKFVWPRGTPNIQKTDVSPNFTSDRCVQGRVICLLLTYKLFEQERRINNLTVLFHLSYANLMTS